MSVLKDFGIIMGFVCAGTGILSITLPTMIFTSAHIFKALEKRFPLDYKPDV
jgi:hypothetical protein